MFLKWLYQSLFIFAVHKAMLGRGCRMGRRIALLAALISFVCGTWTWVLGGTVNLPQTGQDKCYDIDGNEIICSGTGQDGDTQAGLSGREPGLSNPNTSSRTPSRASIGHGLRS
jgi:hypothetical protein